jgi:hypothetical protein
MITAQLERIDDASTKCVVSTDLRVTGKVAQFGRGIMADVSKKLMAQFADNLNTMLDAAEDDTPAPAAAAADTAPVTEAAAATTIASADAGPAADAPADAPAPESAPEATTASAAAAAGSATQGAPTVRKIDGPANEPIELGGLAGTAVLKRLLPTLGGLVLLLLVLRRFRK